MICDRNLIVVLDANVLIEILASQNADVSTILKEWIRTAVESANCNVSGRTVTLLVSCAILDDYSTGFGRIGRQSLNPAVREFFEGYQATKIPIKCRRGLFFAIPMTIGSSPSFRVPKRLRRLKLDKYDRSYLSLLDAALRTQRLSDRAILFASNDRKARNGAEDYAALVRGADRVTCTDMACLAKHLADP